MKTAELKAADSGVCVWGLSTPEREREARAKQMEAMLSMSDGND